MQQLDQLEAAHIRQIGHLSTSIADEEQTVRSLQRLNGEYKEMQNKLNYIINGG